MAKHDKSGSDNTTDGQWAKPVPKTPPPAPPPPDKDKPK